MARNASDVSLEQMHEASIRAMSLQLSLLQGKSRPLMTCLTIAFNAYEQTTFRISAEDKATIKMDLARVVVSQPISQERQSLRIASCTKVLQALIGEKDFIGAIKTLDENELPLVSSACDLYLRIGLLQYRFIADELGAFLYDRPADVLLENSLACSDRQTTTPGVFNDLLPMDFFSAYIAHEQVKDARKKLAVNRKSAAEGPSL
jgi:hypothetical protein